MIASQSSRLANIKNLKEKVMELQRELSFLERVEKSRSKSPSPIAKYQSTKTPKAQPDIRNFQTQGATVGTPKQSTAFKNPTFWGNNPIVGKENLTRSPNSRNFKQPRDHIREMLGMTTRIVIQEEGDVERPSFNQTCHNLGKISGSPKPIVSKFNPEDFVDHVGVISKLALQKCETAGKPSENTPRFKKSAIKTYGHRHVDPILQPPLEKKTYRKVCKTRNLSPQNMLTEHDKSNTRMYLSPSKTPIFLSPQNKSYKKNQSQIVKDLLSYSTQRLRNEPARGKKHFQKHFYETVKNTLYY